MKWRFLIFFIISYLMFSQNIDLKVEKAYVNIKDLLLWFFFLYSGKKSEQVHVYCGCQVWKVLVPFKL